MTTPEKLIPRDYQEEAIQRAIQEFREGTKGVLVADTMGAGKTLTATEVVLRLELKRVLLIAVGDTIGQWAGRFGAQSDGAVTLRRMDSTKKGREAFADYQAGEPGYFAATVQWLTRQDFAYAPAVDGHGGPIYKMNARTGEVKVDKNGNPIQETERTHLGTYKKTKPVEALIFDEFHAIQNKKSISNRTMNSIRADGRIGMSGTWHGNNFSGAWATAKWVWPGRDDSGEHYVDNSYHRWVEEWCSVALACPRCFLAIDHADNYCHKCYLEFDSRDRARTPVKSVIGERDPGAFVKSLPCYIRNTPFPKAAPAIAVFVDISPAQRAQYEQLEADMLAWVLDHEGIEAPVIADLPIVLRQRLRTATLGEMSLDGVGEIRLADDCKSAKLGALRGVLDKLDADAGKKRPAVIYTDSKRYARVVARRMQAAGYRAIEWSGDVSAKERAHIKQAFIDGEYDYIVASIAAVAVGVDGLQQRASAIVWMSRSENEMLNQQAESRVWRPGMTEEYGEFVQVDILANNTLDVGMFSRLSQTAARNQAQMKVA